MGLDYYIIKPRTKEMFYLGRELWYQLEGMQHYKCGSVEYEDMYDVVHDIIEAHCYNPEDTMEYITTLAYEIFDFVEGEEVQLVSDCDEDTSWLNEYKEVKDIMEISRRIYGNF